MREYDESSSQEISITTSSVKLCSITTISTKI